MNSFSSQRRVLHCVFDFDGTLSWIRHGWPEMMMDVFSGYLPEILGDRSGAAYGELLRITMDLNGKPSILQMRAFEGYAKRFGVTTPEPECLRVEFQTVLDRHITERIERIKRGEVALDRYVIPGARALLSRLQTAGLRLSILSSSMETRVREEAEVLGLTGFFEGRIFGSPANPEGFSKHAIFERILSEEGMAGAQLLAFGDGPVEIRDVKSLGGVAVAVCSDEAANISGICDPFKLEQLTEAGADHAIADFTTALEVINPYLAL